MNDHHDHAAAWQVSIDHGSLPPFACTADPGVVTCPDCLEWMRS